MKIKLALCSVMATALVVAGQAAERKVIEITSFDQIRKIDHDTANYPSNAYYKLINDIDASSSRRTAYVPGNLWGGGVFDGQGFTIKGLYTVSGANGSGCVGLFGGVYTDSSRVINLRVEIDSVGGGSDYVGGIAGINDGTISNCSVSGNVGGSGGAGGLVGLNRGNITDSYSTGNVRSTSGMVGGLVGLNSPEGVGKISKITNCYATGNVSGTSAVGGLAGHVNEGTTITNSYATGKASGSSQRIGGLVGELNRGTITKSYATGDVSGTNGSEIGGLVGGNLGSSITGSYATGNVNGTRAVGGLVGTSGGNDNGIITNCYATGKVSGIGTSSREIGGLVGRGGPITNSYATGDVSGISGVGGLVGSDGTITNCYSIGKVSGESRPAGAPPAAGGLVGDGIASRVRNSYWDTETSALTVSPGGGTGKSTAQMKTQSTFAGWNFDTVWTIKEGVSYPSLQGLGGTISGGTFTLRYRASSGGYIAIGDTVQTVEAGSRGSMVVAMPNDGYEFTIWSDGVSNFVRTDSNVTSNNILTANFCAAANIKSLTYKAGTGGAVSGPASQKVCGTSSGLPVTAVPNDGYKFVEWSDGKKEAVRTDAGGAASVEFTASFVIKTYTLVYTAGPNGALIGGDTIMTVAHGSDGGLVLALANDGYEFVKWSDGVTSNPRTDKSVSANIAASAVFDTLRHNVSYYVSPAHGVLAGSAAQRVAHGANGSAVYVTGINGYTFFEWSDGSKDSIRTDKNILADIAVAASFKDAAGNVSVNSSDRVIPPVNFNPSKESAVIAPIAALTAEFTAGPNPADKSLGAVTFFRRGALIKSAALFVYDASGKAVKKITVRDKSAAGDNGRRAVGSWDLADKKGRAVSEGAYLVKGVIKTAGGKSERVSLVVGVR